MLEEESRSRDLTPIAVTLTHFEWQNLTAALRKDVWLQPQLGRLAWMAVSKIEGAIADHELEKSGNGNARKSEVVL